MISLPDVNVLVALFDPEHVQHSAAHDWFGRHRKESWATCPLTENGLVRVLSNPAYPGRRTLPADAVERLRVFRASGNHRFWPDAVSFCDDTVFRFLHIAGYRQLTDVYLLALAARNGGRLVTFDRGIPIHAVEGTAPENLVFLG